MDQARVKNYHTFPNAELKPVVGVGLLIRDSGPEPFIINTTTLELSTTPSCVTFRRARFIYLTYLSMATVLLTISARNFINRSVGCVQQCVTATSDHTGDLLCKYQDSVSEFKENGSEMVQQTALKASRTDHSCSIYLSSGNRLYICCHWHKFSIQGLCQEIGFLSTDR